MQIRFLFFLCVVVLLIKIIAIYITEFDLFGDEAQYWIWSQNPDFGYYSKPPLLAWLIALVCSFFGNNFEVLKLIPVCLYCVSSYVVYLVSNILYNNKKLAILTGLTFFLLPAVTVSSFLISTDTVLILFWSLSLFQILKIRSAPTLGNFILLGIFLGLSFLAKYAAVYFLLSIPLLLLDKKYRGIFVKKYTYVVVFILSLLIVLTPNIFWNIKNNWLTFNHLLDNAGLDRININLFHGLEFIFSQILMIGPIIFAVFLILLKKINLTFETKFLLFFSIPIFLIVLFESILVRANANWAAVSLISFNILFVHLVYQFSKRMLLINALFNFLIGIIFFTLIATTYSFGYFDRINGISSFTKKFIQLQEDKKNILVINDRLLFSNLNYVLRNADVTFYMPYKPGNKVTNHFQLVSPLPSEINKNFIFMGYPEHLNYLINDYKLINIKSEKVLFTSNPIKIYEVIF